MSLFGIFHGWETRKKELLEKVVEEVREELFATLGHVARIYSGKLMFLEKPSSGREMLRLELNTQEKLVSKILTIFENCLNLKIISTDPSVEHQIRQELTLMHTHLKTLNSVLQEQDVLLNAPSEKFNLNAFQKKVQQEGEILALEEQTLERIKIGILEFRLTAPDEFAKLNRLSIIGFATDTYPALTALIVKNWDIIKTYENNPPKPAASDMVKGLHRVNLIVHTRQDLQRACSALEPVMTKLVQPDAKFLFLHEVLERTTEVTKTIDEFEKACNTLLNLISTAPQQHLNELLLCFERFSVKNMEQFDKAVAALDHVSKNAPEMLYDAYITDFIYSAVAGEWTTIEEYVRAKMKEIGLSANIREGLAILLMNLDSKQIEMLKQPVKKVFPLGKIYAVERASPVKSADSVLLTYILTKLLLTPAPYTQQTFQKWLAEARANPALATRAQQLVQAYGKAMIMFEPAKIVGAREYAKGWDRKKMFADIKKDYELLQKGDAAAAQRVLKYFSDIAKQHPSAKIEPLSDILAGISSLFRGITPYTHVILKMQSGVISDILDNRTTMCCAFYPSGENRFASLRYLHDLDIGLLQLKTAIQKNGTFEEQNIIGVVILVLCIDMGLENKGDTVLLVDSAEGHGDYLNSLGERWKTMYYDAIVQVAKDINAKYILFNKEVDNTTPTRFNQFLKEKKLEEKTVPIKKQHFFEKQTLYLESFFSRGVLGASQNLPMGMVSGYVVRL